MAQLIHITPTLYPVVYAGPKETKTQIIPGRKTPLVFNTEPDGTKIAYATEAEAQWIAKNCNGPEFSFPKGTRNEETVGRIAALEAQVEALTARLEALESGEPKRTRRTKAEMEAAALEVVA